MVSIDSYTLAQRRALLNARHINDILGYAIDPETAVGTIAALINRGLLTAKASRAEHPHTENWLTGRGEKVRTALIASDPNPERGKYCEGNTIQGICSSLARFTITARLANPRNGRTIDLGHKDACNRHMGPLTDALMKMAYLTEAYQAKGLTLDYVITPT